MKGRVQFANADGAGSADAAPIDAESAWRQVLGRDPAAAFFYAVTTTGVFCRPSCRSRRPLRDNVWFFRSAAEARAAGFRACKRCTPGTACSSPLEKVRRHIEANLDRAVPLKELGRVAGLSPFTVQRLFKQGLGMTPARFARGGRGEQIGWASSPSRFGWVIVGGTERGLCWLALAETKAEAEASLREEFPLAALKRDPALARVVDAAVETVCGQKNSSKELAPPQVDLRGTAFQLRVWQALRAIPRGQTRSYSQLARELGDPKATRAVARACATNRVALVVPCHRVVGASGALTGYRWGVERKRQLLEAEKAG